MQTSLVLTVLGPDRAGLVSSISEAVRTHNGNWQESRMVNLAGQFAGLAHVTIAVDQAQALIEALHGLQTDGLHILVQQSPQALAEREGRTSLVLELLGHDRAGIVHDITAQLATLDVNIEELDSEQRAAPMSNEPLFYARLQLSLPADVTEDDVQNAFEAMPDPLMVDLSFS